jgi:hypothetical protein
MRTFSLLQADVGEAFVTGIVAGLLLVQLFDTGGSPRRKIWTCSCRCSRSHSFMDRSSWASLGSQFGGPFSPVSARQMLRPTVLSASPR